MKKDNLIKSIIILSIIIGFSACGGGGDDASFKNSEERIQIEDCNSTTVVTIPADYTTMQSGDVLVQEATNTTVTTYHDVNNTKKVCTQSGIAFLIRK